MVALLPHHQQDPLSISSSLRAECHGDRGARPRAQELHQDLTAESPRRSRHAGKVGERDRRQKAPTQQI